MSNEHTDEQAGAAGYAAARLLRRAANLAAKGQFAEATAVQQQIAELLASATASASHPGTPPQALQSPPPTVRGQAVRDVVIDVLNELGVPSSPREVASYADARFGTRMEPRLFASLRRDEQRTWKSTRSHRPVYIVPALAVSAPSRLLAMRGKLALSDWPLERRLLGPWSERVDHVSATANLAKQLAWLRSAGRPEAERVANILVQYARSVPGALEDSAPPDPGHVEGAARAELEVLADKDRQWRERAASQARQLLPDDQQLWGVALPQVIEATG